MDFKTSHCANCTEQKASLMSCSKCKHMQYCSKICQKAHWPKHKLFCRPRPVKTPIQITDIEDIIGLKVWTSEALESSIECRCSICANECTFVPGMYAPLQILQEYEQHGASIFDNMVQDYRIVNPDTDEFVTFYLRPAHVAETKGQRSDKLQTGNCVHLGPNGCTLARNEMPVGCLIANPCQTRNKMTKNKQNICKVWMTQDAADVIQLFEKHQQSKGCIKVGLDDDEFLYNVRLQRVVRYVQQTNYSTSKEVDAIVMAEVNTLGPNAKTDIMHMMREIQQLPFMAKDYHVRA